MLLLQHCLFIVVFSFFFCHYFYCPLPPPTFCTLLRWSAPIHSPTYILHRCVHVNVNAVLLYVCALLCARLLHSQLHSTFVFFIYYLCIRFHRRFILSTFHALPSIAQALRLNLCNAFFLKASAAYVSVWEHKKVIKIKIKITSKK